MRVGNLKQLNGFMAVVNDCQGAVWLESPEGDRYNLKSLFSQYIALDKLMEERGSYLELTCSNKDDEERFVKFFGSHPEI